VARGHGVRVGSAHREDKAAGPRHAIDVDGVDARP
jgi:hypothetical protein